jgi:hypothetical protein
VREAHKWRSHKKNEPKLVSSNNQESLKHFQKRNDHVNSSWKPDFVIFQ